MNLSSEVEKKLLELQEKGLDINDLLLEFLQKREQEIEQKKEEISQEISERVEKKQTKNSTKNFPQNPRMNFPKTAPTSPSRHIPISVKRILQLEHGTKCSIKTCQKPSEEIHHMQRFSASQSHNPRYLAPLCKDHHELAHSADIAYCEIRQRVK